jgi:hypothetical protein
MAIGSYTTNVPLIIPGCSLWMKAKDTSSSNMTVSGGRVASIRNLAGGYITQGTAAAQPANTSFINGFPALSFDADSNRWLNTNIAATLTNCTIFCVVQQEVAASQGMVIGGAGAAQTIRMTGNNLGYTSNDLTTTLTLSSGSSVLTEPAIFAVTCDATGSARSLYKNSVTAGTTGAYDGTISPQYIGGGGVLGAARGGFKLGEMVIFNRQTPADDLLTMLRYLSNDWGIALI